MNMTPKNRYITPKVERLYLSSMNLLSAPSVDFDIYGDIGDIVDVEPSDEPHP